jgi:hypothetical protein
MKSILIYLLASASLALAQTKTVGPQGQGIGTGDRSAFLDALGGTTAGKSLFQMANPSAITFPRINADNTVSALSAADFRTAIGAVATAENETISGNKTFSGQVELTGQLALNDTSAINRKLAWLATANIIDLTAASVITATGTGATARRGGGAVRIIDGDLQTTATGNAIVQIALATGNFEGHFDLLRAIYFTRKWILVKKLILSSTTNVQQFFSIGAGNNIAVNATGLPTSGDSAGWVLESPTSLRLWRCNGGVLTYSSAIDPTAVVANNTTTAHYIWLECNGANTLRLYIVARGFGSGVPTMPETAQITLGGLPNFPSQNGMVLCLRASANNPSAFSSMSLLESKLINY